MKPKAQPAPAGYSGTPLWKKLGYKAGLTASVVGAPANYRALLQLPADQPVTWVEQPVRGIAFIHFFSTESAVLKRSLAAYRRLIDPAGTLWISWPKKTSAVATDIGEDTIRTLALPLGFVDVKVCAVDATWSGLKLMVRRTER